MTLDQTREYFAEDLRVVMNLKSPGLVQALARISRERFLGPGPWLIRGGEIDGTLRPTDSADPRHVHHNVSVAIDAARDLYNGQPSLIASWLDLLRIEPGDRVLHIGCGTGYYTALIAHMTGSTGWVFAVDIDPDLAKRAQANLVEWPWVSVSQGDGRTALPEDVEVVLVHAGATHVLDEWLDAIVDGGRLLVPLTFAMPGMPTTISKGSVLFAEHAGGTWRAKLSSMVAIYSLVGARDPDMQAQLGQAFMAGRAAAVTRLRRDPHDPAPTCWLHGPTVCLSQ